MEVRSIYKTARVSPKKARDVAREIQGLPVSEALDALTFTPRKAAFLIGKTLKSAIANAENNHELAADKLVVKEANVSSGPSFRRFKPRARGSASAILKRTSHIKIILTDEITIEEKTQRKKSTTKKTEAKKSAPKKEKKAPEPEEIEEAPAAEAAAEEEENNS
jgi:large subunit ribosomal protein L22|tara:strand:- start:751 stop:1242 length:492 start_codon:yes stop_codon:yes gene_type:complete